MESRAPRPGSEHRPRRRSTGAHRRARCAVRSWRPARTSPNHRPPLRTDPAWRPAPLRWRPSRRRTRRAASDMRPRAPPRRPTPGCSRRSAGSNMLILACPPFARPFGDSVDSVSIAPLCERRSIIASIKLLMPAFILTSDHFWSQLTGAQPIPRPNCFQTSILTMPHMNHISASLDTGATHGDASSGNG